MTAIARALKKPLIWVIVLTLAYLGILALRPSEAYFGVPGQWTWSGRPPAASTIPRWWPGIVALGLTAIAAITFDKHWPNLSRRWRALAIGFLVIAIPLTQILLKYVHYQNPIEFYLYRTIGPHNGFWQIAVSIEALGDYLRTYPAQMQAMEGVFGHLTTHPPGNILYLWLWRTGFEALPGLAHSVAHWLRGYNCADLAFVTLPNAHIAAALGQMSLPLLSGFTVLPLYVWGKRLGGGQTGWRAASMFALVPALSLFTMRWDSVYPFFAATAFATLHIGLDDNKPALWLLAGGIVSIASFCSFGNAPLAPGMALYAAFYLWAKSPHALWQAWRGWLALLLGGYSVWGIFHVTTGVAFWDLLAITGNIQATLRSNYSYGQWLFYNIYDVLAFTGVPVGVVFVAEAVRGWKRMWRRRINIFLLPALTVSGVLMAVNIAGVSPGEVGRLWMIWMTGMAVVTAIWLQSQSKSQRTYTLLVGLLALQSLWMTLFLRVSPTGMPSYVPRRPGNPEVATTVQVTFEQDIRLVGYAVEPVQTTPGGTVDLTLYWQAKTRPDLPYTIFTHLTAAGGALQAQNDGMPAGNTLPTSCWLPGEVVADHRPIEIPADAPPGAYTAQVGLYYLPTLTRLPIIDGGAGDFFRLPFTITVEEWANGRIGE